METNCHNMFEEKKVFVRLASGDVSVDMLKTVFRNYGYTDILHRHNYAIVEFGTKEKAESAIKDIGNQPPLKLNLSMARKKTFYDSKPDGNPKRHMAKTERSSEKKSYRSGKNPSPASGSYANSIVTNECPSSSSSGTSTGSPKASEAFSLLLDQHLGIIESLVSLSRMSVKDCVVTLTKKLMEGNAKYGDKPQYQSDVPEKINQLFDKLTLLPEDQSMEQHPSIKSHSITTPARSGNAESTSRYNKYQHVTETSEECKPTPKSSVSETVTPPRKETESTPTSSKPESVTPSRNFTAWLSSPGKSMTLRMVKKEENGIICLAMDMKDKVMQTKYNSLIEEFALSCATAKNDKSSSRDGMMAVEVDKGVWYRAVRCSSGWALLDEGTIVPLDQVLLAIPCPDKYNDIPEFTCYFVCDPIDKIKTIDAAQIYSFEIESRSSPDNTLYVKLYDEDRHVTLNGLIKPWEIAMKTKDNEPVFVPKKQIEQPKVVTEGLKRISMIDCIGEGDELQLTMVVAESLGQVCVTYNKNDPTILKHYESLLQDFASACEKEKVSPAVNGKVMAVRLIADQAWYRSVAVAGGWALLDEGHTVSLDKVDKCVACPQNYFKVPEFCVLFTNAMPLKPDTFYCVKIISKDSEESKVKVKVFIPNEPSTETCGYMIPFAQFREEQTMAQLLEEKVNNSMIMTTVKACSLTKLDIKAGSQVVVVNHVEDKVYLRQSSENAKRAYLELLDKLILSGPKLSTVTGKPEKDDLIICKYGNHYHRAVVDKYCLATNKCDLTFLDIGQKDTVSCSLLKIVPVWATEVPIMTNNFTLAGVESETMSSAITSSYLSSLIDAETPLTCIDVAHNQIVLQTLKTKQNVNQKIIDLVTPNWKKIIKKDGILKEPVVMEQDMQYVELKKGQKIKILQVLDKALSVSVVDYKLEDKLKELTKEFSEYCNSVTDPYLPRIDELCFYKNKDDGTWNRGCALRIDDNDTVGLVSLDYGSSTNVHFSLCRKMLKEFSTPLPFLAVCVTVTEIGPEPSEKLFDKTCNILNDMEPLVIESAVCDALGVYNIKIKGLAARLEEEGII